MKKMCDEIGKKLYSIKKKFTKMRVLFKIGAKA